MNDPTGRTAGFTDEVIPGADWTDREMWTAIGELMEPVTTVTTQPKTIGRGHVLRAACSLEGCGFVTNPRGTADDVVADMIRHAVDGHAALVRKRIRDVQRRARIDATREQPVPDADPWEGS